MLSSKYEVAFITEVKFSPRNFLPSPLITHTNNKNQGSMRKTNKIPQKRVADKLVIKLECNTLPRDGMEIFFFLLLLFRRGCTNMFAFEKNENPLTLNFEPFFFAYQRSDTLDLELLGQHQTTRIIYYLYTLKMECICA